jgi:hypothetical protein
MAWKLDTSAQVAILHALHSSIDVTSLRRLNVQQRILFTVLSLLMLAPSFAIAQDGGGGRYATRNGTVTTTELADGGTMQMSHYTQVTFADDADNPLDGHMGDCAGLFMVDAAGTTTHASGSCISRDAEGDFISYWWQMTDGGTDECPDLCGVFSLYGGYGKYEGLTGRGRWQRLTTSANGGTGTWGIRYSR